MHGGVDRPVRDARPGLKPSSGAYSRASDRISARSELSLTVLELEDRGADVLDRAVQVVDGLVERLVEPGVAGAERDASQLEPRGEETLDHHVVQVPGDPFPVGDHGQLAPGRGRPGRGPGPARPGRRTTPAAHAPRCRVSPGDGRRTPPARRPPRGGPATGSPPRRGSPVIASSTSSRTCSGSVSVATSSSAASIRSTSPGSAAIVARRRRRPRGPRTAVGPGAGERAGRLGDPPQGPVEVHRRLEGIGQLGRRLEPLAAALAEAVGTRVLDHEPGGAREGLHEELVLLGERYRRRPSRSGRGCRRRFPGSGPARRGTWSSAGGSAGSRSTADGPTGRPSGSPRARR